MLSSKLHVSLIDDPEVKVNSGDEYQNWVVLSFISPDDMIVKRFYMDANKFLVSDVNKQLTDATQHIATDINRTFNNKLNETIEQWTSSKDESYKYAAEVLKKAQKDLQLDETEQVEKYYRIYAHDPDELLARFEEYRLKNKKELDEKFDESNSGQKRSCIRGVKIRGVYESLENAKTRCEFLRTNVKEPVHAYVAPIGKWVPWDPNPDAVQDQEYALQELNELMKSKRENEKMKEEYFNKRKADMRESTNNNNAENIRQKLREKIKDKRK